MIEVILIIILVILGLASVVVPLLLLRPDVFKLKWQDNNLVSMDSNPQCQYNGWTEWGECKDGVQERSKISVEPYDGKQDCMFIEKRDCSNTIEASGVPSPTETSPKLKINIKTATIGNTIDVWAVDISNQKTKVANELKIDTNTMDYTIDLPMNTYKEFIIFLGNWDTYEINDISYNDISIYKNFKTRGIENQEPKNLSKRDGWRSETEPLYRIVDDQWAHHKFPYIFSV